MIRQLPHAALAVVFIAMITQACVEELDLTDVSPGVSVAVQIRPQLSSELANTPESRQISMAVLEVRDAETGESLVDELIDVDPALDDPVLELLLEVEEGETRQLEGSLVLYGAGSGNPSGPPEWSGTFGPSVVTGSAPVHALPIPMGRGGLANLEVAGVELSADEEELLEGESTTLQAEARGTPSPQLFWSSDDPSIASVDQAGKIEAHLPGSTEIRVVAGMRWTTIPISVLQRVATVEVLAGAVRFTAILEERGFAALALDARGDEVTGREVSWSSDDASVVAHVGEGVFRAMGGGTAQIEASVDGMVGSAEIEVEQVVAGLDVEPAQVTLRSIGATAAIEATPVDANGFAVQGMAVEWSSSDQAVATVDATGLVVAISEGTATLTAGVGGVTAEIPIAVDPQVAGLEITPDELAFTALEMSQTLEAVAVDELGAPIEGVEVTWSSTDQSVAVVDETSGEVRSVSPGMVSIIATADEVRVSVPVTVFQLAASIVVSPDPLEILSIGGTGTLTAVALDATGHVLPEPQFTWRTGDEDVAVVDENGLVTAVAVGSTFVVAELDGVVGEAAVSVEELEDASEVTATLAVRPTIWPDTLAPGDNALWTVLLTNEGETESEHLHVVVLAIHPETGEPLGASSRFLDPIPAGDGTETTGQITVSPGWQTDEVSFTVEVDEVTDLAHVAEEPAAGAHAADGMPEADAPLGAASPAPSFAGAIVQSNGSEVGPFVILQPHPEASFTCIPFFGADLNSRGYYIADFPIAALERVDMFILNRMEEAGEFTLSLTAREGSYDGALVGVAETTLGLPARSDGGRRASFSFEGAETPKGGTVTFSLAVENGPDTSVFYFLTHDDACPITQTSGTNPPLSSPHFGGRGIGLELFGSEAVEVADPYEPNNTLDAPFDMDAPQAGGLNTAPGNVGQPGLPFRTIGTSAGSQLLDADDVDIFRFAADEDGMLEVVLDNNGAATLAFELWAEDGELFEQRLFRNAAIPSSFGPQPPARMASAVEGGRSYLVKIYRAGGGDDGPYELHVELHPHADGFDDPSVENRATLNGDVQTNLEPNDFTFFAGTNAPGALPFDIMGTINAPDWARHEVDLYRIPTMGVEEVEVLIRNNSQQSGMRLGLHRAVEEGGIRELEPISGPSTLFVDGEGHPGESITFAPAPGEEYFFSVALFNTAAVAEYDVCVRVPWGSCRAAMSFTYSGNGQGGDPGTQVGPLTVIVVSPQESPVDGVRVRFSTSAGTLSDRLVVTEGGLASTTLTLPQEEGPVEVTAHVVGIDEPVVFTVYSGAPP